MQGYPREDLAYGYGLNESSHPPRVTGSGFRDCHQRIAAC